MTEHYHAEYGWVATILLGAAGAVAGWRYGPEICEYINNLPFLRAPKLAEFIRQDSSVIRIFSGLSGVGGGVMLENIAEGILGRVIRSRKKNPHYEQIMKTIKAAEEARISRFREEEQKRQEKQQAKTAHQERRSLHYARRPKKDF